MTKVNHASDLGAAKIINPKTGRPFLAGSFTGHGAGFGGQLGDWNPVAKTVDAALLPGLQRGNARADDLVRNNAIASNGVQLHIDNIVGHLFRLSAKPKWRRLGISEADARSLGQDIEAAWSEYAEDSVGCYLDAERKRTFTMMIREGIGTHTRCGEIMSVGFWEQRTATPFRTMIKSISPKRVCNPNNKSDTSSLRGGVEQNSHGVAHAYYVRNIMQNSGFGTGMDYTWERIARETKHGRQKFIHVFEPEEDGQTRGANKFLGVMEQMHMLPKLQNTKLQNAIVNAMFAAVIESELDPESTAGLLGGEIEPSKMAQWMEMKNDYHQTANIKMGNVRVPHLLPTESLNLQTSGNVDNGFAELEASILRWVAAGLNVPFEALAQDYSKVSYSSARASMLQGWRYFMGARKIIAARYANCIYSLWLEEAFASGQITMPRSATRTFYEAKASWCNAEWIGSGRMAIDGLKEVKEAVLRIEAGLSTYEKELAQMGEDYQEIFDQQVRETAERKEKGLPLPSWVAAQALAPDEMTEAPAPSNSDN